MPVARTPVGDVVTDERDRAAVDVGGRAARRMDGEIELADLVRAEGARRIRIERCERISSDGVDALQRGRAAAKAGVELVDDLTKRRTGHRRELQLQAHAVVADVLYSGRNVRRRREDRIAANDLRVPGRQFAPVDDVEVDPEPDRAEHVERRRQRGGCTAFGDSDGGDAVLAARLVLAELKFAMVEALRPLLASRDQTERGIAGRGGRDLAGVHRRLEHRADRARGAAVICAASDGDKRRSNAADGRSVRVVDVPERGDLTAVLRSVDGQPELDAALLRLVFEVRHDLHQVPDAVRL